MTDQEHALTASTAGGSGAPPRSFARPGMMAGHDGRTVPDGYTLITARVSGSAHSAAGVIYLLCCDSCGSLVGNVPAHQVLCA